MSIGKGLPLATAQKLVGRLLDQLGPSCERIEVAGSIRRQAEHVGDIELVAIPRYGQVGWQIGLWADVQSNLVQVNRLDQQLERMLAADERPIYRSRLECLAAVGRPALPGGDVRRWGPRAKRFYLWAGEALGVVAVDLFITTADCWGAILAIRTGPRDFSTALVTHLLHHTPYQQKDGALVRRDTGAEVPVPEERDYFAAAGLLYILPPERSASALVRARIGWVKPKSAPRSAVLRTVVRYNDSDVTVHDWLRARLLAAAGV